jgi:hypothetical protein
MCMIYDSHQYLNNVGGLNLVMSICSHIEFGGVLRSSAVAAVA